MGHTQGQGERLAVVDHMSACQLSGSTHDLPLNGGRFLRDGTTLAELRNGNAIVAVEIAIGTDSGEVIILDMDLIIARVAIRHHSTHGIVGKHLIVHEVYQERTAPVGRDVIAQ